MKILTLYKNLLNLATTEFRTIVESGEVFYSQSNEPWKVRLYFCDGSFMDIYHSLTGKYSYHWDRRLTDNTLYRHDNAPHQKWENLVTFPKHFHNGSEELVVPSYISETPDLALKELLVFAGEVILKAKNMKEKPGDIL